MITNKLLQIITIYIKTESFQKKRLKFFYRNNYSWMKWLIWTNVSVWTFIYFRTYVHLWYIYIINVKDYRRLILLSDLCLLSQRLLHNLIKKKNIIQPKKFNTLTYTIFHLMGTIEFIWKRRIGKITNYTVMTIPLAASWTLTKIIRVFSCFILPYRCCVKTAVFPCLNLIKRKKTTIAAISSQKRIFNDKIFNHKITTLKI